MNIQEKEDYPYKWLILSSLDWNGDHGGENYILISGKLSPLNVGYRRDFFVFCHSSFSSYTAQHFTLPGSFFPKAASWAPYSDTHHSCLDHGSILSLTILLQAYMKPISYIYWLTSEPPNMACPSSLAQIFSISPFNLWGWVPTTTLTFRTLYSSFFSKLPHRLTQTWTPAPIWSVFTLFYVPAIIIYTSRYLLPLFFLLF